MSCFRKLCCCRHQAYYLTQFYLAKYYEYENNCCLSVRGKLGQRNPTEIIESKQQSLPNNEEFKEAVRIPSQNEPSICESIQNNILKPYLPMPPLLVKETYGGDIERTLCVGLRPTYSNTNSSSLYQHEIIAANMISKQLLDLIIEHLLTLELKNQFVVLMLINPLQIEEHPEVPKLQLLKEIRYYEIS